jgi:hypothetical protein
VLSDFFDSLPLWCWLNTSSRDDGCEGLAAVEHAVASGCSREAPEPSSSHLVLAQHLHHPSGAREMFVDRVRLATHRFVGGFPNTSCGD